MRINGNAAWARVVTVLGLVAGGVILAMHHEVVTATALITAGVTLAVAPPWVKRDDPGGGILR